MVGARDRWLLGAFVLSGAAALGYEILWTRLLALALGSEVLGVLGVLAGFFGGMALGAAALHERARRSEDPVRLFARLELCAAAFAVLSPFWLHALASWLPQAMGPGTDGGGSGPGVTIAIAAAVLLPGTFCLGATLPALVEARRRTCPEDADGRGLGRLYAANTAGAVLGVLGTIHLLLPLGGMVGSAVVLAALGVAAALVARAWGRAVRVPPSPAEPVEGAPVVDASRDPDPDIANEPWLLLALLLGTGVAGVGLEVVAVHVLSQILENTIFTFAHVLAIYLLGTAAGAALYTRHAAQAIAGRPTMVAAGLVLAHALATVWAAWALGQSPGWLESLGGSDASYGAQLLAEAIVAGLVLGPATLCMGALFSHVAGLLAPRGIGHAYALNTLGGAIAPFAFGVGAIESMGYRDAMFAVVYTYLALFGAFTWFRRFKPAMQIGAILGVVVLTTSAPDTLLLVRQAPSSAGQEIEHEVLEEHQTLLGAVVVTELRPEGAPPYRRLQVGQRFYMGGRTGIGELRMGHIPLLLHPEPRRALFLGVGTGSTVGAVVDQPTLEHVDAVELVPAVLEQLHHFSTINRGVADDERVHFHAADARRFVAASFDRYDVIVADLFHPGRDGAGNLYAREHFENVAQRLDDDGLFAQWLPLYQLDPPTLRVIIRTFCAVFDEAHAVLGIYNTETPAIALIGRIGARSSGPLLLDVDALGARMNTPIHQQLLMSPQDLLGAYLLPRSGLLELAGPGPVNTDLSAWVALYAPRRAYVGRGTLGRDNLMELVEARVAVDPSMLRLSEPAARDPFLAEVAAFAEALRHYLRAESVRQDTPGDAAGYEAATEHFLAAYDAAPGFRPARGLLVQATMKVPRLGEHIFSTMLARTPAERLVWHEYVEFLRRHGDPRLPEVVEQARQQLSLSDDAWP